jgi:Protein of Unknown function (DUF2784)
VEGSSSRALAILVISMLAMALSRRIYSALAVAVLALHALSIVWVIFGAFLTRKRPLLRWLHIVSLMWGILIQLLPWTCSLTYLEDWFENRAGIRPYEGGFLLHYLDKLIYPDVSIMVLVVIGTLICAGNLFYYGQRAWIRYRRLA